MLGRNYPTNNKEQARHNNYLSCIIVMSNFMRV